jgi:hypothetical protein
LVAQWGRTSRDDVIAAYDTIGRGRKAIGAVLNKVDPRALRSSGRTLTGCRKADSSARPV